MQANYSQEELNKVDQFRQMNPYITNFIRDDGDSYEINVTSKFLTMTYRSPTTLSVSSYRLSQYDPTMDGDYGNFSYIGALLWDNTKSDEDKYKDVINALVKLP